MSIYFSCCPETFFVHWNDGKVTELYDYQCITLKISIKKKIQKKNEFQWRDSVLYIATYCRWRLLQSSCCAVAVVSRLQLRPTASTKTVDLKWAQNAPCGDTNISTSVLTLYFRYTPPRNLDEFSIKLLFFQLNETFWGLLQLIIFMRSGLVIWL